MAHEIYNIYIYIGNTVAILSLSAAAGKGEKEVYIILYYKIQYIYSRYIHSWYINKTAPTYVTHVVSTRKVSISQYILQYNDRRRFGLQIFFAFFLFIFFFRQLSHGQGEIVVRGSPFKKYRRKITIPRLTTIAPIPVQYKYNILTLLPHVVKLYRGSRFKRVILIWSTGQFLVNIKTTYITIYIRTYTLYT